MLLNVLIAGTALFFINSCMVPVHFVGYQFRALQDDKPMVFSQYLTELSESQYLHYKSQKCSFYFHKKSAHYYAVCQKDKDIYFIGTDVRSNDVQRSSDEDVVTKLDQRVVERLNKIKTTIGGLNCSSPSFAVYKSHELDED